MSRRLETNLPSRRAFLGLGLVGAAALTFMPRAVMASAGGINTRALGFFNTHTTEILKATYWRDGTYDKGAIRDINQILRDHRTGEVHPMDLPLLDLLVDLHRKLESGKPFEIISGYRSPKSNATLAAASGGVAKKSLHMQGKAIDIRLRDVKLKTLRAEAIALQRGGVGFYPKSEFVHVDTGRVRQWG
ncbi:uncharacterized protein YcbK (DUF882 family) [Dongia mobilis]|uniref:Murein endopeptidase K n=1 Tax=Dongia mobilis TaxID=578943 RepID=A0A4R6WQZ6_9PROT|nr:DUF882 domain-containing protein [Dongia mobilis]TDQ84022.1 uncharacterized protein YcbK (DUF882 family) [Dongia mobilis]